MVTDLKADDIYKMKEGSDSLACVVKRQTAVTRLWNDLPNQAVESVELEKFKLFVNDFMFSNENKYIINKSLLTPFFYSLRHNNNQTYLNPTLDLNPTSGLNHSKPFATGSPAIRPSSNSFDQETTVLLSALLKGPLVDDDLLVALDDGAQKILDLNYIFFDNVNKTPPVVLLSTDDPGDFFLTTPIRFLRGYLVTAVMIFMDNPKVFLDSLDHRWNPANLILINLNLTFDAGELLQHEVIQRSEKVALMQEDISNKTVKFFVYTGEPYKVHPKWKLEKRLIGLWDTRENFPKKRDLLPERFHNFNNAMLYLGSWCDDFPFLYPVDDGKCTGTSLDLLQIISKKLNFTYDVQMETADHNWGSKENGNWTGMLGDVIYNNKDLVVNYFLLTETRNEDFDSTRAYYSEGFAFALKIPPPKPQWPGLLYPFSGVMWLSVILTVTFTAILLTVFLTFIPEKQKPAHAFLLIVGGVLNQSVRHRLVSSWSRLYTGWWWLCALIITCGYTSNLIAFLTVPVYPTRIETVDELAASGLRVCMQDYGNFLPEALKISTDASLYKLGHNLDLFPYAYLSYEIGFGWVLNDTHAIVDTKSYLVYLLELYNHTDDTYLMKEEVYPGYLSWLLKKNCPYTNVIAKVLETLVEAGFVDHLYMKHMAKTLPKDNASQNKISKGKSLQIGQLLGAFMLWGIGGGVATIIFAFECIAKHLK
ncbi:glutamate receptor ionotropic, delta-2-like [Palaemon carinicauda]|uniref:glutamate receptor ionotropic, delta-2-like n=1 Tax=Palaemon carinicauda TaxID=392227 RepID=UPI0035B5878E